VTRKEQAKRHLLLVLFGILLPNRVSKEYQFAQLVQLVASYRDGVEVLHCADVVVFKREVDNVGQVFGKVLQMLSIQAVVGQ
jgi:hypothetical protein